MPAALIPDVGDEEDLQQSWACMETEPDYVGDGHHPMHHHHERESIRRDREREGRCADCGMQTHSFRNDDNGDNTAGSGRAVKVPLNVEGEVRRGRCLLCYPIFPPEFLSAVRGPEQAMPQQSFQSMTTSSSPGGSSTSTEKPLCFISAPPVKHSRRVSQAIVLGFHNPSDPAVVEALRLLQGMPFDIVDIVSAMKRAAHDRVVQERGCERLWVLSWEDENSAAIGRVGAIPVVLSAMARFPLNAHLQQCACECLQNLAHVNHYNRREISDYQGIRMIVTAMMRHMDCAGIQQCGCTALASIATTQDLVRVIMASGGFHAVLLAARRFEHDPSVLRAAYDGLQAMGYDPDGRLPPLGLAYVH
jgi:hypothetical protein